MSDIAIHWFRQDLRLSDNPSLIAATKHNNVLPIYILDLVHFCDVGPQHHRDSRICAARNKNLAPVPATDRTIIWYVDTIQNEVTPERIPMFFPYMRSIFFFKCLSVHLQISQGSWIAPTTLSLPAYSCRSTSLALEIAARRSWVLREVRLASRRKRGPVALRPWLSPGLPL